MCGLTGFICKGIQSDNEINNQLELMTSAIKHRGPDDFGYWVDKDRKFALGHRRLSILDLSEAGHQPMVSKSSRFIIAFNGEIYNHLRLRKKLEDENNAKLYWNGHSDTETLLSCFELWGIENTLEKITGMFSIALIDRYEENLYLIRDRMGEKPLYYGWVSSNFVFGSELKSLKAFKGFSSEIDRNSLALFLKYDYVPAPNSIYKNIKKLPQGSYLSLSIGDEGFNKNRSISVKSYWDMQKISKHCKLNNSFVGSEEEAIEKLEEILGKSIKDQMISDVPLGAFLSGGIDSSLTVALMQKYSQKKVKTFTIGFSEKNYNEAEYAKAVAEHLKTEHTELYVTPEQAIEIISKLPSIYDEPFADSSQLPTFLVSKLARNHVTVSLSGDGGDELFGGYNRYFLANRLWKKISKIPWTIRVFCAKLIHLSNPKIWSLIFNLIPQRYRISNPSDKIYKLSKILVSKNIHEVYERLVTHWDNPFEVVLNSKNNIKTNVKNFDFLMPEEEMMLKDSITYLPDDILTKVDRASMSVSLETRAPFLDKNVIEFAWKLPFNMKIRNSRGKWILRKILDRYVPNELIDRPKMGFGVPIDSWLRGPLKEWAEDLLSEKRLKSDGYFNVNMVREKWKQHLSGEQNWQYHLWSVLMFQLWLDKQENCDLEYVK